MWKVLAVLNFIGSDICLKMCIIIVLITIVSKSMAVIFIQNNIFKH